MQANDLRKQVISSYTSSVFKRYSDSTKFKLRTVVPDYMSFKETSAYV